MAAGRNRNSAVERSSLRRARRLRLRALQPPGGQGASPKFLGRDHRARAFTMWLAGGGIEPGGAMGQTDKRGYKIVEDPVNVHDVHAAVLHLFGVDHTKLTYTYQDREFRLTDAHGEIVNKLLT